MPPPPWPSTANAWPTTASPPTPNSKPNISRHSSTTNPPNHRIPTRGILHRGIGVPPMFGREHPRPPTPSPAQTRCITKDSHQIFVSLRVLQRFVFRLSDHRPLTTGHAPHGITLFSG